MPSHQDATRQSGDHHAVSPRRVVAGAQPHHQAAHGQHHHVPVQANSHVRQGLHDQIRGSRVVQQGHSHVAQPQHSHVVAQPQHSHVVKQGHSHVAQPQQSHVVQQGHSHVVRQENSHVRGSRVTTDQSHLASHQSSQVVRRSHSHVRASHSHQQPRDTGERRSVRRSQRKGAAVLVDSHVTSQGEGVVVDEHRLQGQDNVVEVNRRESHLISSNVGEGRVVDTHVVSRNIVNQYDHALPETRTQQGVNYSTVNKDVFCNHEQVHVNQIIKEKFIDVIVEKPVPVERFVDVPYDVYVERPVEKIIEKEVVTEKIIEIITDVIIEIPIEKIVEYPIEKIIEKPIYIEEIFEIPVEVIIEDEVIYETENIIYVDSVVECEEHDVHMHHGHTILPTIVNQIHEEHVIEVPRYVDNIVEKIVHQEYENIIEQEVVYECHVDAPYHVEKKVWQDRINVVEKHVDCPYETHVEIEHIVERPVYIDNPIRREIPVERRVEKIVERKVDNVVEKYVDRPYETRVDCWHDRIVERENIIEQPIYYENVISRPYYTEEIVERPVENKVYNYYDVIREVDVPVEKVIRETIECPVERICENHIEQRIEHPVERRVEHKVPVENIVYVDKVIINEVENYIDNVIEHVRHEDHIIEQEVIYEVEKRIPVEHLVEKVIEVKREYVTEVQVDVEVKREVYIDRIVEKEVVIENKIEKPIIVNREVMTELDIELEESCHIYSHEYKALLQRKEDLEELLRSLQNRLQEFGNKTDYFLEVSKLRKQVVLLEVELSKLRRTTVRSVNKEKHIHVTYIPDQNAVAIRSQIEEMKSRNATLKQKIDFQNTRISHGGGNYVYEEKEVEGKKVRQVRKSNRNKQNENVHISNAGDHHLVSQLNRHDC